ncbi:MAG: STAS domain-containing protein [Planctomycetes bacterium]|nr:STAS domain-containing protein [Planctomycetota bacterium]MBM4087612.1 STAS domain-containing protein [Planctomycetota bacterium]
MTRTPLLTHKMDRDVHVVSLQGTHTLAESNLQQFSQEFDTLVGAKHGTRVLINLQGVDYITSPVIAKLTALSSFYRQPRGQLKLCCLLPHIRQVLAVMKIDRLFDIHDTEEEALESFAA